MNDTPRVDAALRKTVAHMVDEFRSMEREITSAHKRIAELEQVSAAGVKDAALKEVWSALNQLSFSCFGVIGVNAPTVRDYNETFAVMEKYRAMAKGVQP